MKHWPKIPLEEICTINPKLAASERPPVDCDVTFVPMAAVDEFSGTIARPEVRQYREVSKGYTPFCDNDVLFAKITPCMENGKAAIARGLVNGVGFGSTEFHILRPTPAVLPEWIFAFIRQPAFRAEAQANFTGTAGHRRVPLEFMGRVPISVPPLGEQERIVKLLGEADQLRELRVQADRASDALIPALFQEQFGDPATNPKGWPLRPAGELMGACDYGTSQKANDEGRGITVLRMGNVQKTGELDLSDLKSVELSDAELTKQTLEAGDVLFNRTNSRDLVGKTGMWDGRIEAVAASYFIRVRFNRNIELPEHFTAFMNLPFMKRRLAEMARGAVGQANINAKELKAIRVPVPPLALQRQFSERATEIRTLASDQAASRQRLDDLYQSMLHDAFSGNL